MQQQQYRSSLQQQHHQRRTSPRGSPPTTTTTTNNNVGASGHSHIIQSKSKSTSHGLSSRARSRSRGKSRDQQQYTSLQQTTSHLTTNNNADRIIINNNGRRTPQDLHSNQNYHTAQDRQPSMKRSSSLGNINNNSLTSSNSNIHSKIDEYGRCINHPNIELACRDNSSNNNSSQWRILLQDCPLCSLDVNNNTGLSTLTISSSSNKTTIDNRTITTEESTITTEESGSRIRPPPPPRLQQQSVGNNINTQHIQQHANHRQNSYQQQQMQQKNKQVQSLKELGRKLVLETEGSGGGDITQSTNSTVIRRTQQQQQQQQQQPPPPPRFAGQHRPPPPRRGRSNDDSMRTLLSSSQQQQQKSIDDSMRTLLSSLQQQHVTGMEDANAIIATEEEKWTRAQHRQERAEQATTKSLELLQLQQQQLVLSSPTRQEEHTFTIPMNDIQQQTQLATTTTRGRDNLNRELASREGRTDDILQAAAQIRARARRSASRSRERIKDAALFCGETVVNDDNDEEDTSNNGILLLEDGKQESVSQPPDQLKRRSILNPHGLEDEPRPTQMERRSQSRERRRSSSRGRHRNREIQLQPPTTAEDLLNRRREMRQRIAERQSNATQSRTDRRRRMSSGDRSRGTNTEENDDTWTRTQSDLGSISTGKSSRRHGRSRSKSRRSRSKSRSRAADEKSECNNSRRGRSRSAVRDTFSKIRSASLTFRKKDIGIDLDDEDLYTVDTGKRSTGTTLSKRLLSKKEKNSKPRSLSGGRRKTLNEWGGISEPHMFDESMGSGNFPQSVAKSETFTRQSSSRLGLFKKSNSKKKLSGIRSLSRGKFRDTSDLQSADTFTERRGNADPFTSWEMAGSQRSVSSTGRRQWRSGNEFNDF